MDVDDDMDPDANVTSDMMVPGMEGTQAAPPPVPAPQVVDLLGGLMDDEPAAPQPQGGASVAPPGMADLFGAPAPPPAAPAAPAAKVLKLALSPPYSPAYARFLALATM